MNKNNYFALTKEQQALVLNHASAKIGLPPQAVEKDIWVSTILQIVFSLPFADRLIFKGGTSLSKVWGVINRFSEDIDLAVDRALFDLQGDLTKRQIKKLRKESSVFVRSQFSGELQRKIDELGLSNLCALEAEPDGEGDGTYPEPRKLFVRYQSALSNVVSYLQPVVMLEIGSRSLVEPNEKCHIQSMLEGQMPSIRTSLVDADVSTAIPAKTFLEKAFLLHEIFSVEGHGTKAERKSRHLYDLYMMKDKDFAQSAVNDAELWESIRHHREVFTSVQGLDYTPDVRRRLQLVPRADIIEVWRKDYEAMRESMIYGSSPTFEELIAGMTELQERFRSVSQLNI